DHLATLPGYLSRALAGTVQATFGLSHRFGVAPFPAILRPLLAVLVVGFGVWTVIRRRRVDPELAASAVGVLALFGSIWIGRSAGGNGDPLRPRYIYEAAALLLVGLGSMVGRDADPLGQVADSIARRRWLVLGAATVAVAVAVVGNGRKLSVGA